MLVSGFLVNIKMQHVMLDFEAISERIALSEDQTPEIKNEFSVEHDKLYNRIPNYDVKLVLGFLMPM